MWDAAALLRSLPIAELERIQQPTEQVMGAKLAVRKECDSIVAAARAGKIEAEDLMRGAQVCPQHCACLKSRANGRCCLVSEFRSISLHSWYYRRSWRKSVPRGGELQTKALLSLR